MHASPFSFLQWSSHHLGRSLPALSCARLGELLIQEKWNCTFISFNMSVLSCVLIYVTATLNWILKTSLKFLLHSSFLNQCFYGRTRARTPSSWCHSVSIYIYQDSDSSVSPNNSFFSPLRIWVGTWAIYLWLCPATWILGRFLTLTLHSASHSRQHHHCPSPTRKSSCTSRHFCGMWLSGRHTVVPAAWRSQL